VKETGRAVGRPKEISTRVEKRKTKGEKEGPVVGQSHAWADVAMQAYAREETASPSSRLPVATPASGGKKTRARLTGGEQ
jgi:hypothetical protein